MTTPDDDGRWAADAHDDGHSWTHIGAELGCSPTAARNLATTYLEDLAARQQQDQPTLF